MKNPFKSGDQKTYRHRVTEADIARFESGLVHPFYATFALGRDAEWAGRLFVLEMKEEGEEGIGTYLTIEHKSPALLGDDVDITATLERVERNSVECSYEARVGNRLIATGTTGQKILLRQKIDQLVDSING
ncbi:MAG: hypothetical protein H6608_02005 [Flavobacteriales bacterium]|nr:hypothetical protein [Bacteroidota bacterium]MCB9239881.1 hypothetical protein [Flavobacteriales bacterium]